MRNNITSSRRFITSAVMVVILTLCFAVTTYAITRKHASSYGLFQTGEVKINLNDERPIISGDGFWFEPGITIERRFFVENEGDCDVYFKVYFDNVNGELADVLNVKVMDGDSILFNGTPKDFTKINTTTAEDVLKQNERRDLTIFFHYPEAAGNITQGDKLNFNLCAKAVQAKNNSNKEFE